jgi:hypothetical protein
MKHQILMLLTLTLLVVVITSNFFGIVNSVAGAGDSKTNASNNQYSIEQAISDQAQLNTHAFSGLGFLTGELFSDSFLPPGKVADFFGFQYLRDTTQAGMGHSTDFVTNAANNVLFILNSDQKTLMMALAKSQTVAVNEFAFMRYPLMVAFRRQLNSDLPNASCALSKAQVMNYSAGIYELDAQISSQRAQLFASIIRSLNETQIDYLNDMVQGGFASWPALGDQVDKASLSHDEHVLVMTYASEMFGWYAGDIEADTYFCPERHADYFGGFYIKDAPAMGNPGYTIDESITGDKGEAFLAALDASQRATITSLVNTQKAALGGIVENRRAIATELRKALNSGFIDEEKVKSLSAEYGELDGEISYYYATAFAEVAETLTSAQMSKLIEIRDLTNYPCEEGKIYLYSEKIDMPEIRNTDFLFTVNNQAYDQSQLSSSPTPIPTVPTVTPNSTTAISSEHSISEYDSLTIILLVVLTTTAVFGLIMKKRIDRTQQKD